MMLSLPYRLTDFQFYSKIPPFQGVFWRSVQYNKNHKNVPSDEGFLRRRERAFLQLPQDLLALVIRGGFRIVDHLVRRFFHTLGGGTLGVHPVNKAYPFGGAFNDFKIWSRALGVDMLWKP